MLAFTQPAAAGVRLSNLPGSLRSEHFTATVNGHAADVAHAAANYYFLSFDVKGTARITIEAPVDGYWDRGVEVQPWRLNIRPTVRGRTITFSIHDPVKLSISRPGDHLGGAEMLFLFANPFESKTPKAGSANLRYYGPGEHHENIDAHSGDNIYLAAGAVVYGALNLWEVSDVHVFGRGVIVYDGPQDPDHDQGWMHRKNWHCMVTENARRIRIEGITCAVRSRTWMIQMRNSRDIRFENVKVIGGSPGNANQDGMDWLGGGDTVVHDSFIRAADDVFAMYGNWDGYDPELLERPGEDVSNIVVDHSILSTSISNIVRVGWPHKTFNSDGFTMRDTDVIHMGIGSCGVPFALMEIWATPGGKGQHIHYLFENIRIEDWYSLVQLQQSAPSIRDVRFTNVWALASPQLVPSSLEGDISGVSFRNVVLDGKAAQNPQDLPLALQGGAAAPAFQASPHAQITYTAGLLKPQQKMVFVSTSAPNTARWEWSFGDGGHASGREVRHKFSDARGTLQDGSGRYRVLLRITDTAGNVAWSHADIVIGNSPWPAQAVAISSPGLAYRFQPKEPNALAPGVQSPISGTASTVSPQQSGNGALTLEGFLQVPADGGYTFTLLATESGALSIDGHPVAVTPKPWPNVCDSPGFAVQSATASLLLQAGKHSIQVQSTHSAGTDGLGLRWEGPGILSAEIPPGSLMHTQFHAR